VCEELVSAIKRKKRDLPVIVIESAHVECPTADYRVRSFDPAQLLEVLRGIEPRETQAIDDRDVELNRKATEADAQWRE
jgi:hypothetical protein